MARVAPRVTSAIMYRIECPLSSDPRDSRLRAETHEKPGGRGRGRTRDLLGVSEGTGDHAVLSGGAPNIAGRILIEDSLAAGAAEVVAPAQHV